MFSSQRFVGLSSLFLLLVLGQYAHAQAPVYEAVNVDSVAVPRGGYPMLETFLKANVQKPFMAQVANIMGKVYVKAIVEPSGRVSEVQIVRGLRPDCDREALRAMGLFNAWKPAIKGGQPVRQSVTYPVAFRANEPTPFKDGMLMAYYDIKFASVSDPATARYVQLTPIDTLTGMPNGDVIFYEMDRGVKGKEASRFPLVRNEIKPTKSADKPTYQVGHKQPTSDWLGLIYTLDATGKVLSVMPADRQNGREILYASNGMVRRITTFGNNEPIVDWYPDGQLRSIMTQKKDKPADYTSYNLLVSAWDSTGKAEVTRGNGYRLLHYEAASRRDSSHKTTFVEEGAYADGLKQGIWKGRYADGSYSYEEQYEKGGCKGGKALLNGKTLAYDEAMTMPEFAGGVSGLYAFLGRNIRYPADAQRKNVSGKVFLSFTVCTDGSLCDYEILKGVHPSIDEEALRVAKRMPNWKPGVQRGEPVRTRYRLPVSFQLE
ncbi:TonB family protein [Fibrella sp. HMF5335]|uniref:TonB family protein n=1 Tax=Fibrella rubiginis TaxID=2817060 RepID=A0A939K538_9BACT|nr:TonB family protein [Fibrella rubiginis]MBO0937343.1 TonB family protein [Fibrella rubiginis]